jgi:hypothetical protein
MNIIKCLLTDPNDKILTLQYNINNNSHIEIYNPNIKNQILQKIWLYLPDMKIIHNNNSDLKLFFTLSTTHAQIKLFISNLIRKINKITNKHFNIISDNIQIQQSIQICYNNNTPAFDKYNNTLDIHSLKKYDIINTVVELDKIIINNNNFLLKWNILQLIHNPIWDFSQSLLDTNITILNKPLPHNNLNYNNISNTNNTNNKLNDITPHNKIIRITPLLKEILEIKEKLKKNK